MAIMAFDGTIVARYFYDAWGDLISVTDANGNTISSNTHVAELNSFRYKGYMYDDESGFYYLRSRYYDPSIGRFLNADELIQSDIKETSLYVYGKSNPVKYGDSNGLDAIVLKNETGLTHIGVMMQDEQGQWWHFYWGTSIISLGAFGVFSVIGFVPMKSYINKYNQDIDPNDVCLIEINESGIYKHTYTDYIYLVGDFSKSVVRARSTAKSNGDFGYSITLQNCVKVSLMILSISDTEYSDILIEASKCIRPKNFCKNT